MSTPQTSNPVERRPEPFANDSLRLRLAGQQVRERPIIDELRVVIADREAAEPAAQPRSGWRRKRRR